MRKIIPGCALALCLAVSANAQDAKIKTETKVKADNGKVMTMTGCLTGGAGSDFMLSQVERSKKDRDAVGTSGSLPYALMTRDGLDLGPHIGQKVEVTGVIVPAASKGDHDDKIQVNEKSKVEIDGAPDKHNEQKTEVKVQRGAVDHFMVASVKDLNTTCVSR